MRFRQFTIALMYALPQSSTDFVTVLFDVRVYMLQVSLESSIDSLKQQFGVHNSLPQTLTSLHGSAVYHDLHLIFLKTASTKSTVSITSLSLSLYAVSVCHLQLSDLPTTIYCSFLCMYGRMLNPQGTKKWCTCHCVLHLQELSVQS